LATEDGGATEASDLGQEGDAAMPALGGQHSGKESAVAFIQADENGVDGSMIARHVRFGAMLAGRATTTVDR
jgi:hypothetical protein